MKKKEIEIINRIHSAGYLREIESPQSLNHPKLNIRIDVVPSRIIGYGTFTVIELHLTISADRPTHIIEFGAFQVEGREWNVDWCPQEDKWPPVYLVGPVRYPRNVVLNHRTGRSGAVAPGLPMEGVLLGLSQDSVPFNLRSSELRAELTVVDGYQEFQSEFPIRFDQTYSFVPKRVRWGSLFDGGKCPEEYRWIVEGKQESQTKNPDVPSPESPASSELRIDQAPANKSLG